MSFTAGNLTLDASRMVLRIKAGVPAKERTMATKKTTAKRTTSKSRTTKTRKPKATKKEELVVFAIRLTEAERDAIHKTAGPRNATRFIRQVAKAFARKDEAAFRATLKEAAAK